MPSHCKWMAQKCLWRRARECSPNWLLLGTPLVRLSNHARLVLDDFSRCHRLIRPAASPPHFAVPGLATSPRPQARGRLPSSPRTRCQANSPPQKFSWSMPTPSDLGLRADQCLGSKRTPASQGSQGFPLLHFAPLHSLPRCGATIFVRSVPSGLVQESNSGSDLACITSLSSGVVVPA